MKLIHADKGGKVFLGDNFKSDLNIILKKSKLRRKAAILVTGFKSFVETNRYTQLKTVFKHNEVIIVKHIKAKPNPSESRIVHILSKPNHKFDFIFAL